jgi:hypothetical protein
VPLFESVHEAVEVNFLSRIVGEVVELAGVVLEVVELDERR